jgi:2-polyprenyl-6-methoxyphenol hydroxylase-like FAD-dependent oxidoreductase
VSCNTVLARILQRHGIESTVYEADPSADSRRQGGGSLDMHVESGQRALREAGLYEEFEIVFTDGTTVTADLVVGADGTWSKVRPLLSKATPEYVGVTHIELGITDVARRYPDSAAVIGPGALFALSDRKSIGGHGGPDAHLAVSLRVGRDWLAATGVDWSDAPAARDVLLEELADWSTELTDLIRRCDDTMTPRQIFALPIGHSWTRVPGVTLLGDAAHVMSPYAGEGANLAMLDAAELAGALVRHGDDLEAALDGYEPAMFARAEVAARMSAAGLEMCFSADAPREIVAFFTQSAEEHGAAS